MNGQDENFLPVRHDRGYSEVAPHGGYGYTLGGPDAGSSMSIGRVLSILRDKIWWIIPAVILGGALGWVYSRGQPQSYLTTASVWLEAPTQTGPIRPSSVLGESGWVKVFTSNAVMEPVVREFGLYAVRISPPGSSRILRGLALGDGYRTGVYRLHLPDGGRYELLDPDSGVLESGSLADGVGASRGFEWHPDPAALSELREDLVFRVRAPAQAASALSKRLVVSYEPKALVIQSQFRWSDPVEAAEIHNGIIDSFIETAARLTNGRLREEVEILDQQTASAEAQLNAAERALQQFGVDAITKPGLSPVTPTSTAPGGVGGAGVAGQSPLFSAFFQQRATLDQIESDVAELDAILDSAEGGKLNILRLRLVPSIQDDQTIPTTIQTLDQLELDRRTQLYTYTPEAPAVMDLTARITDIHQVQLPSMIRELQRDLGNRRATLENQLRLRREELESIPGRAIEQGRLSRQTALASTLVTTLRGRLNAARLAELTALSNVRPLDRAFRAANPEGQTSPPFYIFLGALAGMGLAVGAVLFRDRMDSRIRHPDDIAHKFGMPLLGVVPQLKSPKSNPMDAAVAIESFRSIRTQLAHTHVGDTNGRGRVLITSSTPREGKSVVAANLAISYSAAGLRTLLVDADVRRGRLHAAFGFPRSPGLTEHLAEEVSFEDIVRRDGSANLDVICSGALTSNPEIIGGDRLDAFLDDVSKTYDAVVIDGPPLAAGADALIIGQRCDQVIMVFRAGVVSEEMAQRRLAMLGNVELPIVGAVLNAIPSHAPYYKQYVSYYYYAESEAS